MGRTARLNSFIGPNRAIACVTDPPGDTFAARRAATYVLAVPVDIDLRTVFDDPVIDRRLPPVELPEVEGR